MLTSFMLNFMLEVDPFFNIKLRIVNLLYTEILFCDIIKPKVKMKLSIYLFSHYAMRTYGGIGGTSPSFLELGTRWR
jgi:hypothetical protein